jgi:hypothetical protein
LRGSRGLVIALALLVVIALAAGAFVVFGPGDDGAKVVLEPIGLVQENDFAGNFDVGDAAAAAEQTAALNSPDAPAKLPDPRSDTSASTLAGRTMPGTAAAAYGGNRDTQVCDVAKLAAYFKDPSHATQATAFAGVLGITAGKIPGYLAGLTAMRLRYDTRVTNHGYEGGEATAFPSLLQAGTGVLVDAQGVPRVKCNCANPLSAPAPLGDGAGDDSLDLAKQAENPDDAWKGLDPAQAVTVTKGKKVAAFNLVNLDEGGLVQRPVGSDGQNKPDVGAGDVQVKLEWASASDLDLHVTEPDGTQLNYLAPGPTKTNGRLDVDSNVDCKNRKGVENAFWPLGKAPKGHYKVDVVGFRLIHDDGSPCGPGDFTVTITVAGKARVEKGKVAQFQSKSYEFDVK